jgi:catechol 2,3-dioxygenase-like lactoylglutathione lyase family enzyme
MGDGRRFEFQGVHHVALVCQDMARTVEFYRDTLGLRLVKTIELPMGLGQHFFFDIGNGDSLAFFWFRDAPPPAPGVATPVALPGVGEITTAIGSMNHLAFNVPADDLDAYMARLRERGVECTEVRHHDDSEWGVAKTMHPGVFVKSVYFFDPDGICLEFAAWTRALGPDNVRHPPVHAPVTAAPG